MMNKNSSLISLLLFSFLFLSLPNCAYFNTFYLANRNFKDAERFRKRDGDIRPENKKFYTAAIEQASAILQDYKKSRYVDDSLFIIGMSYFHTREFVNARTKYDELLAAFPQSEFAEEAKYYRSRCLIELGQSDSARADLGELAANGSRSMRGRAGVTLAEINFRGGGWEDVVKLADGVIASSPERQVLQDALLFRGDALMKLEKNEDAIASYQRLRDEKPGPRIQFMVNSRMAECLARLKKYDEARSLLEGLQNRGNMAPFAPSIRLGIGKIYEMKGDAAQAVDVFSKMAADFPDSVASLEAWYRAGIITLRDLSKAQDARDSFVKATAKTKVPETWFTDALGKISQIDSLKARTERIDKLKEKPEERAHERFLLAELLVYSLGHEEAAIEQYKSIIEEAPKSEYTVRSEFLMGLADSVKSGNRTDEAERGIMHRIVEKYPDSRFSQELKVRLGLIDLPPDSKLLAAAEQARAEGKKPETYLTFYQAVMDSFANTRSAYQAELLMAFCYEFDLGDREKALGIYKKLAAEAKNDQNREFVDLAANKIAFITDEKKIIDDAKKNIAFYQSEIEGLSSKEPKSGREEISPDASSPGSELSEMRKIRERNARIRSRYFTE